MATLENNTIAATYESLLKTCDNCALPADGSLMRITDGSGIASSLSLGKDASGAKICGPAQVTGNLTVDQTFAADILLATTCIETGGNLFAAHSGATCRVVVGGDELSDSSANAKLTVIGNLSATNCLYAKHIVDCSQTIGTNGQVLKTLGATDPGTNRPALQWTTLVGEGCVGDTISNDGGTNGCIVKFNGACGISNSIIRETSSKIGIDKAPSEVLDVNGNVAGTSFKGNLCGNICGARSTDNDLTVGGALQSTNQIKACAGIRITGASQINGGTTFNANARFNNGILDCAGCATQNYILCSTGTKVKWIDPSGLSSASADEATKLATPRNIDLNGQVAATAQPFDGSANITIEVTELKAAGLTGTIAAARLPNLNACCLQSHQLTCSTKRFGAVVHTEDAGEMHIGSEIEFHTATGSATTACIITDGTNMSFGGDSNYIFNGKVCATGDIIAFSSSDKNLKDNIIKICDTENIINKVSGYSFDWNKKSDREGSQLGLIAQEVEEVLPTAVCTREDGTKALDYVQLIPVLIEEVKRLNKLINDKS